MTLEQFQEKLKELLREALAAGHPVDQICEVAEYILSDSWEPTP